MQVTVEKISNIEQRLTIIVPANQVEGAYNQQIEMFAKKASIKGFRPGKVPLTHIKQRFGNDARNEAISSIIQHSLGEAIKEHDLKPVSTPRIELKKVLAEQPLEFTASFEVLPDIEGIQFNIETLEKLLVDVLPADVDYVIGQLRKQHAVWKQVERGAQEKDRVVIDYHAIIDGDADLKNKVQNFPLELGSKAMFPGFEEGLIGATVGEEKTLSLTFPDDFKVAEKAGKPIEFVVQIKQIFAAEIPELDEQLMQKLGIKSGKPADLTQQIKQSLEQERDRLVKEKLKEQIFQRLLTQNPIDAPLSLVAREAKSIHDEIYPPHQQHNHQHHSEQELKVFEDIARKRVALGLLIAEYAKKAQIIADKDRVRHRIQEIASVYEKPQEVIEWFSSDERRQNIEAQVIEDQVVDKLMEGVTVIEKVMSYAELKGINMLYNENA